MPTLTARADGFWEVAIDWKITTSRGVITVRKGFVTDGASVPRMAWLFAGHPMETPRVVAALAHDWLYRSHVVMREVADLIYMEILLRYRAKWRVLTEWKMLDWFGGKAWNSYDAHTRTEALEFGSFEPKED